MKVVARKSDSERMALTTICLLLFVVRANEVVAKARIMLPDWVVCPEKEWIDIIPTQAGFDAKRFNQLIVNSNPKGANFGGEVHDGNKWGAVLTRGGYLVYTWGDPDYKYQSASLGKAFTWALIDLAVDEGLIKSDEPIWKSWNGKGQLSHPHKYLNHGYHKTPTWQHLLSLLVSTGGIWKGKRLISPEWIRSYVGGNGSLVAGDRETYISVGVVCARGLPSLKAFKDIIVGPVVVRKP